tara:strand:+ start:428 stop:607 length:180 start_codon:yes stop_codon:yes gene_type:complete
MAEVPVLQQQKPAMVIRIIHDPHPCGAPCPASKTAVLPFCQASKKQKPLSALPVGFFCF